jgi:PAS domain S-box-containing protein
MNPQAYALLGLTVLVALIVGVVAFAALRFAAAARDSRRHLRGGDASSPLLASALQEAIGKLRDQERATAERADASERLSTQIVDSVTAGLLVVDPQGQVQILNPAGRKMLGVDPSARLLHYRDLPAPAAPLAAAIEECLAGGQAIVRRALEVPGGGEVTHVGVTVSPLHGTDIDAEGAICLFSDLTAVIELEDQLRLKETLARLGELTAGIAHEFRNGLATIHGYGKLLDPEALPERFRPHIQGIRQETEALGEVVTNFLNFARPAQLSLATHPLGAIVGRAADDLRPDAQQLGGGIVVNGEFGDVEADDVLLRQAFMNLVRNGVEACQQHGVAPAVRVEGTVDRQQGVSRVSIHDNGPGIPPEERERVFRPFFTTRPAGTGLGLALVQKIIVTHNGRITAGPSPDGGACFHVTLPLT